MKQWIWISAIVVMVGGCAVLKQAKSDYSVGESTPVAVGETSPSDVATSIVQPVVPFIPVPLQPLAGIATLAVTAFLTWKRGRTIRLGKTPTLAPETNWIAGTLTAVGDVFKGIYEVGPDGSALKRTWKTAISTVIGLVGVAVTVPAAKAFILGHPDIVGLLTVVSSTLAGIEKELSTPSTSA